MNIFNILEWDSNFFDFNVVRIEKTSLNITELQLALEQLKSHHIKLAYWVVDPEDHVSIAAAEEQKLFLADVKLTYVRELLGFDINLVPHDDSISEYHGPLDNDLVSLAYQSGIYSRFKIDPNIPSEKFLELYRLWIRNSVNRSIANHVFVKELDGRIAGMVTVGTKSGRGDIGLIAVDESARGMKIGEKLVNAALQASLAAGHSQAQVVTQGKNEAACHLYDKCGYKVEKAENIYHIWP